MTKVTIDRELLERVVDYYAEGEGDLKCIAQDCREALSAPRQQEGNELEVVAWLGGNGFHAEEKEATGAPFPLCHLSDAQRAIADLREERDTLRQQRDKLAGLLREARELIDHGDFREGWCMCGSGVEGHSLGDGHTPVDAGECYAGQIRERIDAALSAGASDGSEEIVAN